MSANRYPSLAEIRAQHANRREYERYLIANRYLFRPPSFPAIWLLVRLGVSSETASWLSGAAAFGGFVCLLWPGEPLLWPGVALLVLFNFLDCLDGGIARAMRTRNPYGRFLDSIMSWADVVLWGVVGVAVWRMPELRSLGNSLGILPGVWLAAGMASSFLVYYAASLESIFDQVLRGYWETLQRQGGVLPTATPVTGKSGPEVFVRALAHNLRVRETHYVLLAAACALGRADALLAFFLALNLLLVLALLFTYCARGRKIFNSGLGRETAAR